jgi:AraC-like DNA-binding protein
MYDFFSAGLYNSDSFAQGIEWQRLQFSALALVSLSIIWLAYFSLQYKSKKIFILSSLIFSALFLLGIFVEGDLTLSPDNPQITHVTLGSFIDVTYYEAGPGTIYILQMLFMILISAGIIFVTIQHYIYYGDDTEKQTGPLYFSLLVFFFAVLNDIFVTSGVYSFLYLLEYASLIIIVTMAYMLQVKHMEHDNEVSEQNVMLKEKINETSMELLFSNIGKELYRETFNELLSDKKKSDPSMMKRIINYNGNSSIEKISRDMSIVSNMDELLNTAIKKAVEICGADQGSFFLADSMNRPKLKAFYTDSGAPSEELDESIYQKILQEDRFLIIDSGNNPSGSFLFVPVKIEDEFFGIVSLKKSLKEDPFTDQDAEIMSVFLAQSAIALENAFLYQRMKNINRGKIRHNISATSEEKIKRAMQYIEENYMYDVSRENLAASIDMHPDSLSRYFKIFTGKKFGDYINEFRVKSAAEKLKETDDNIIDVAFSVGFESLTSFNRAFLKFMGTTPKKFRDG